MVAIATTGDIFGFGKKEGGLASGTFTRKRPYGQGPVGRVCPSFGRYAVQFCVQ
jgi:hypothetical protein